MRSEGQPVRAVAHRRSGTPAVMWLVLLLAAPFWLSSMLLVGEYSLSLAAPFLLSIWILWRYGGAHRHDVPRPAFALEWLAIGLALAGAWLSLFNSAEPIRAFRVVIPMAYGIATVVMLRAVPAELVTRIVLAVGVSGAVILAYAITLAFAGAGATSVMLTYRFKAFFENPNQLALAIAAFWPAIVALALTAPRFPARLFNIAMLLIFSTALLLSGAKTGMAMALAGGCFVWLYHAARSGTIGRAILSLTLAILMILLLVPVIHWVLSWASPITFEKVNAIIGGGISDYASIQSRNLIWAESLRLAFEHPLTGVGAGTRVMDHSHSHNMIIDYFRGLGVLGMVAALLLLVTAFSRCIMFGIRTLPKGRTTRSPETFTFALYVGAIAYLAGNQISDSFSPSTAFIFWLVYTSAITLSAAQRSGSLPRVQRVLPRWNSMPGMRTAA